MTKIAVVGGGAAGIGAAYSLIKGGHDVTLFEADTKLGGHCFGVPVDIGEGQSVHLDAGVSDFNQRNFVNVKALLDELGLKYYPVVQDASFMRPDRTPIWYSRQGQWTFVHDFDDVDLLQDEIARFNTSCKEVLYERVFHDWTCEKYLESRGYSEDFKTYYFYPRAAGCFPMPDKPPQQYMIRTLIAFYSIHGIVGGKGAPRMVIEGGMFSYCEKFSAWFLEKGGKLYCDTPVIGISRRNEGVRIRAQDASKSNLTFKFDHVVIAVNSNQVLPMFEDSSKEEIRILNNFQWQRARLVVHTDDRIMPSDPEAWRSYNYVVGSVDDIKTRPTITFYPYSLASLHSLPGVFVTMNPFFEPEADKTIYNKFFVHPASGTINDMACQSLELIQGYRNTWFAGAYLREPFVHEQAYSSGFDIGNRLVDFLLTGGRSADVQMQSFDDFLINVPLFEGLEPSILSDVNLAARPTVHRAGEYLFQQGQQGDGMYLLREGRVCVEVRTPGDEVLQISEASHSDILGEMSLMDDEVRSASARALEDTSGYFISRQRFEMLKSDLRPAGIAITNRLASKICSRCRVQIEEITGGSSRVSDVAPRYDLVRKYQTEDPLPCDFPVLRQFAAFSGFSDSEIASFLKKLDRIKLPAGVILFSKGEAPDGIYIVLRGALRLGLALESDNMQLNIHGPGGMAGYIEVIEKRTRVANLTTREASDLVYLPGDRFAELSREELPAMFKFLANLNVQSVRQLRKINNISSRIASFGRFSH